MGKASSARAVVARLAEEYQRSAEALRTALLPRAGTLVEAQLERSATVTTVLHVALAMVVSTLAGIVVHAI